MTKVEVLQNRGLSITFAEEEFRRKLDNLYRELNKPNQFKGRLNSLITYVKLYENKPSEIKKTLDEESLESVKNVSFSFHSFFFFYYQINSI